MADAWRWIVKAHAPIRAWVVLACAGAAGLGVAGGVDGPYRVLERIAVGGQDDGYDFLRVDDETQRLYIAHRSRVEVLNTATGKVIGQIPDTPGVHGIALAAEYHHGFTSNGADRTVTMFDLPTLRPLMVIRYTGVKPDAIEYDPETRHVYVVNGGATSDLTVIAPDTGAIVGSVSLPGSKLEQLAFDGRGRAFVNDEDQSAVHVFDTHTLKPMAKWSVAPGEGPTGIAYDAGHHRLFVACGNRRLIALNADTGAVVATLPIGADPDGAAFDGGRSLIFVSNRDGTLTVIHEDGPDRYRVLQNLVTEPGARTIALDNKDGRIYLPFARFGAPPPATQAQPEPRSPMIPESFGIVVVGQ
jgi:DNA-binding beta-propeller fold protein YncE